MNTSDHRRCSPPHARGTDDDNKRNHHDIDADHLIGFARMWAPYGGGTDAELFVLFGMTRRRFIQRLWHLISESNCERDVLRVLAAAYPPPEGGRNRV